MKKLFLLLTLGLMLFSCSNDSESIKTESNLNEIIYKHEADAANKAKPKPCDIMSTTSHDFYVDGWFSNGDAWNISLHQDGKYHYQEFTKDGHDVDIIIQGGWNQALEMVYIFCQ